MASLPVTTVIRQEIVIIASTLAWCGARERRAAGGQARRNPGLAGDPATGERAAFPGSKGRFSPDLAVLRP